MGNGSVVQERLGGIRINLSLSLSLSVFVCVCVCVCVCRMADGSVVPERLGGIRIILPSQYAYKSVKFLRLICVFVRVCVCVCVCARFEQLATVFYTSTYFIICERLASLSYELLLLLSALRFSEL